MQKKLFFVLFDSITNSVFSSQVLAPLIKRLNEQKELEITLVSFEKSTQKASFSHPRLRVVFCKKPPFLGQIALWLCVRQLKKLLKKSPATSIMARGPFAGWIALGAASAKLPVIVQARGLAAEEFRYVMEREQKKGLRPSIKRVLKGFLYRWYEKIEKEVYGCRRENFTIETVSQALKDYIEEKFHADPAHTSVSTYDVPEPIPQDRVKKWRQEVRRELGISENHYVYCYMGSARAWQCVDEMIDYFSKQLKENKKILFLILSQDKKLFEEKLRKRGVLKEGYRVMSVKSHETYRYLSAANAGLLFRKKDIVNYVARPTKLLEYQSVGLRVIGSK